MFFGAIPMGFATIVNGTVAFGPQFLGDSATPLAEALWWIDAAMAIACGLLIPFFMFTRQDHSIERMRITHLPFFAIVGGTLVVFLVGFWGVVAS